VIFPEAAHLYAPVEKHFQERSAELQIPPLRYAPVGMTKERVALPFKLDGAEDEQQIPVRLRSGQALQFAPPDSPVELGGVVVLLALFFAGGARGLVQCCVAGIRVRSGRDDNSV
jgi:hypothetical protein